MLWKHGGEKTVHDYGPDYTVLRFFNVLKLSLKKHNNVKDIIGDLLCTEIKIPGRSTKYTHN